MADDKKTAEENARMINPRDREALKRAADDLLKKNGKASAGESRPGRETTALPTT